ncbi:MAG: orotate phosphoribosyltransferase [Nanoarchaeota archaeon]|nr:orotate phosphoribosyltransferase [Nanoarchaeota archaeon]
MEDIERLIAKAGLEINAIKLNPDLPFQWASGYMMPIYNDNRMFLSYPEYRKLVTSGFQQIIKEEQIPYDIIAGTSTAGIAPGALLAERLNSPFIYIRDKTKDHGLKNQIEGIDAEKDLEEKKVIVIEDLISTGGSSAKAVQAVRDANGDVNYCLSIFNYGLKKAMKIFRGIEPYDKEGNKLQEPCEVRSILAYDVLLDFAKDTRQITKKQIRLLKEWRANPLKWGEKHGFPKIEKGT